MKFFVSILLIAVCISSCSFDKKKNHSLTLSNGQVKRIEKFDSKFVVPRNLDIWLPDNYSTDSSYAVLYMHDGQMLFDATQTWNKQEWGLDETMSQLLQEDAIRSTIVVGIWNTELRHAEYFPQKPYESLPKYFQDSLLQVDAKQPESALFKTKVCSDNYLKFIVQELKPYIDSHFATLTDFENTFIAGSSMGGLISLYALCEYPEIFKGAACLSTHWVGTFDTLNNPIPLAFADYLDANLPPAGNHLVYFDFGTETLDAFYEPYQVVIDSIMKKYDYNGANWKTLKFEGADHSEAAWGRRLDQPLTFLLGG